jgi:hypothetical protein
MARATGLEPATSGVTGRHSNQLSYARAFLPTGAKRSAGSGWIDAGGGQVKHAIEVQVPLGFTRRRFRVFDALCQPFSGPRAQPSRPAAHAFPLPSKS